MRKWPIDFSLALGCDGIEKNLEAENKKMWLSAVLGAAVRRGRRVPRRGFDQLTSKIGPIGYYKGKGGPPAGRHTSKGGFHWDSSLLAFLVLHELKEGNVDTRVDAYVTAGKYVIQPWKLMSVEAASRRKEEWSNKAIYGACVMRITIHMDLIHHP